MDNLNQKELTNRLNKYRDAYYNHSDPLVTDAEYDALFDKLKKDGARIRNCIKQFTNKNSRVRSEKQTCKS